MSNVCKINIPNNILERVKSIKDKNELQAFGLCHATNLVNNLLNSESYQVSDVHIFSLNNIENVQLLSEHIIN